MKYEIATIIDEDGRAQDMDRITETLRRYFRGQTVWVTVTNRAPWEKEAPP